MSKATKILDEYYEDITKQVYPDWDEFTSWTLGTYAETHGEEIEAELLKSVGLSPSEYMVVGVYEIKPEFAEIVKDTDYTQVYFVSTYGYPVQDMIALFTSDLIDVTDEVAELIDSWENGEDWSEEAMLDWGKQLYNQYGPDAGVMDMSEYDAECYLAYTRSIGE